MARSPLTLAAAATVAVPGAEYVGAAALTNDDSGRNDAAVLTDRHGVRVVARIPLEESADADLVTESLALRALSDGVRSLLPFTAPEFLGAGPFEGSRVFVRTFVPGYLVDAAQIPAGRGVAASLGRAIAAIHALPSSVVRAAGLPVRSAEDVRNEVRRIAEDAAATGRVPVRLMIRWRDVLGDDAIWQFEPTVTLGGAEAGAYVYHDRDGEPAVSGVIDWHGFQVGDPALDLRFLSSAPEAIDTVFASYAEAMHQAPDDLLRLRARLHSELEFARWLLHGRDTRRDDIMDDAAALLDSLAEGIRDTALRPKSTGADIDDALAALRATPQATPSSVDTSMQTDTYSPEDFALLSGVAPAASEQETAEIHHDLGLDTDGGEADLHATEPFEPLLQDDDAEGNASDVAEAERAAQAAIRRWSNDRS